MDAAMAVMSCSPAYVALFAEALAAAGARAGLEPALAESLAAGLPMILTHPIPGPEERHAQYLARHGVAVLADPEENIGPITNELLSCRDKLREMKRRAHELSRPDATHTIAQIGRAMLEREDSIELLPVPYTRSGDSAYLM